MKRLATFHKLTRPGSGEVYWMARVPGAKPGPTHEIRRLNLDELTG
jgi:hypothetical protein